MINPDLEGLYKSSLEKYRRLGGYQFVGICPFHEDNKESFSGELVNGLWNCKACGIKGNTYQFAEKLGIANPHQYIQEDNPTFVKHKPKVSVQSVQDLTKKMDKYRQNLIDDMDRWCDEIWDTELIDDLHIGLDDYDNWVFGYSEYQSKTNVIGIKIHKKQTIGDGSCKWYPINKIAEYDRDKPIIICEGEKDVLTLLSYRYQAISGTAGAMSVPKDNDGKYDLKWLEDFKEVIIVYDNDDSGKKGSEKLSKLIVGKYPYIKVRVVQWNEDLPKGFDVFDSFIKDDKAQDFYDGLANAKVIKTSNQIGGLKMIQGSEASNMEYKPTIEIIESLMPEKTQIVLGGTTGSNKSYMAMQMGMSIANNEDEFLGFKINVKGLKVLYCDTEVGEKALVNRYQEIKSNMNWNGDSKFNLLAKNKNCDDFFQDLENAIEIWKPDIVILDCLYNVTNGEDISKNHHLKPVLDRVTAIKDGKEITFLCVHHSNKGGHEQGLVKDRISGGSYLQNWVEHMILMTDTNVATTRLMKIDKSRHIDYPRCYFELEWNPQEKKLSNRGVSQDWRKLLITNDKQEKWGNVLRDLPDEFTKLDFKNVVEGCMNLSSRTATYWIQNMLKCKIIEKIGQGKYKKKLDLLSEE